MNPIEAASGRPFFFCSHPPLPRPNRVAHRPEGVRKVRDDEAAAVPEQREDVVAQHRSGRALGGIAVAELDEAVFTRVFMELNSRPETG